MGNMSTRLMLSVALPFLFSSLFAQKNCSLTPVNKKLDLRTELYSDVSVVTRSYKTTSTAKAIGGDVSYLFDICGSNGNNCTYDGSSLVYDVYYPSGFDYSSCSLPAIFLFHGGGFSDCSGYSDGQMVILANDFAKRGFVAFNVEYRRGVLISPDTGYYTAQQMLAIYRADQDARGAIRSAIRRQREKKTYNEPYSIDTNNIFVGGRSAGSVMALNVGYYQKQSMIDKVMPGIKQALGSINADFYLGDTTTKIKIKGVLNMWGGAPVDNGDTSNIPGFFKTNSYLPAMIAFCGEKDPTFNYLQQPLNYVSPTATYPIIRTPLAYENRCINAGVTYNLNSLYPKANGVMLGGETMYTTLKGLKKSAEIYLDSNMKHGLDDGYTGFDGFGLGTSNTDSILIYIAQRSATFFQAVMNNFSGQLKRSQFENCQNYRFADNKADNNACGRNRTLIIGHKTEKTGVAAKDLPVAGITIVPNPVHDVLRVRFSAALTGTVQMQISDANGTIWLQKNTVVAGSQTISVPVSNLASGMYYLKLVTEKQVYTAKWIKL